MTFKSTSLAATILLLGLAPASAAGANRTFVSGQGSDTNPCTITAPCRSLQAAVNATAAAGEVVILTPGGYGTVTITQSITIANDGVGTASISVPSGGNGITINATDNDNVQLRGLEIDGNNVGSNGIQNNMVGALTVLNCVIRHNDTGIYSARGKTNINNSTIGDQYGTSGTSGGAVFFNSTGIISNTLISGNAGTGVFPFNAGVAYVDHDTITRNLIGLQAGDGGTIYTFQNNDVSVNTQADVAGTLTTATPK